MIGFSMNTLQVYNLEFPDYIHELNIGGYRFVRVPDYENAFKKLQHKVEVIGSEFHVVPVTGSHQITATVEIPDSESDAILPWNPEMKATLLQDVVLFLTLFTGRNVFALEPLQEKQIITADPRLHPWGAQFHLSIQREIIWQNRHSGEIISDAQMQGQQKADYNLLDFGLENTIKGVLATIMLPEWKNEYDNAFFLFTFRQAMRQDNLEPAFLLCWTIWEHLFAIHNRNWLDASSIEQTSGDKKIAFILNKYLLVSIDDVARGEIKRIARARNRLVHFGPIPENVDYEEMEMFIRLTEQIVAIVLRLEPSNAFNSLDRLKEFLKES